LQLKSVCDQKRNSKLATQRLFPRHFYRGRGYVNSDYIEARRREEERVLACAASDIENRSNQIMSCDEPLEGGLVSPDVPWWGPVVIWSVPRTSARTFMAGRNTTRDQIAVFSDLTSLASNRIVMSVLLPVQTAPVTKGEAQELIRAYLSPTQMRLS
jgi:hypothetical protein